MSDHELLLRYTRESSQEAFTALVQRHLNLVYSAARRQVRSPELAQEVAQSVFIDLARQAHGIAPGPPLCAWLFTVTRRTAIDVVRREVRRQARERTALEIAAMKAAPSDWTELEPHLDEAIASLPESDRRAILLRYFENKSLREIGAVLGTTDDAAQKRLSRALDRLRTLLTRRGLSLGSGSLAAGLTAGAVQAAPAGLGASITAGVAALGPAISSAAVVGSFFAMTTLKKILVATLVLGTAGAVYETRIIARQRAELTAVRQTVHALETETRRLRNERDQAWRERAALAANFRTPAGASTDPEMESAIEAWIDRVQRFRERVAAMPERQVPEMRFLAPEEWLSVTWEGKLESDHEIRKALSTLRHRAKNRFANEHLRQALLRYMKAHGEQLPTEVFQLAPYFGSPIEAAILERYEIVNEQPLTRHGLQVALSGWRITEKAPVDDDYDTLVMASPQGTGIRNVSDAGEALSQAVAEFRKANGDRVPTPAEVAPFLKRPVDPEYLQDRLEHWPRSR